MNDLNQLLDRHGLALPKLVMAFQMIIMILMIIIIFFIIVIIIIIIIIIICSSNDNYCIRLL